MQERSLDMNSSSQANIYNRNSQQEKQDNNGSRTKTLSSFNGNSRSSTQSSLSNTSPINPILRRPGYSNMPPEGVNSSHSPQNKSFANHRKSSFTPSPRGGLTNKKYGEGFSRARKTSFGSEKWSYKEKALYTKEQYMMANCTFLVDPKYNMDSHNCDPDLSVDWSAVRVVYQAVPLQQLPMCPICMDVPRCARVAPCGHQYCWPCAVRYVRYIDWQSIRDEATASNLLRRTNNCKRCAICTDQLDLEQLKSVVTCAVSTFAVGDEIDMMLMRRQKGSILAVPVDEHVPNQAHRAKVRKISTSEEKEHCQQDALAIQSLHSEAVQDQTFDVANVCQELYKEVRQRLDTLQIMENNTRRLSATSLSSMDNKNPNLEKPMTSSTFSSIRYVDAFEGEISTSINEPTDCDAPQRSVSESSSSALDEVEECEVAPEEPDADFFYQSKDGQHIYLHSLNWSCISYEYGPPQNWPRHFTAKILQIDNVVVDLALRKRYRYLCHLPVLCPIQFVEVQLCPPLISEATLLRHKSGLDRRENERVKREHWEKEQDALFAEQLAKQQAELIERQSRNVYARKVDLAFNEEDFVPLNVANTVSEVTAPSSSRPSTSSVSFAHVASRPATSLQGAWGASRNRQLSSSGSTGAPKQNSPGDASDQDNECLQEFCPPPEKGFFARCSAADFVVNKAKKQRKKK